MTSITNWLGALALAIILGTSHYLDQPSANWQLAQAQDVQDAIKSAATEARFARAATQMCVTPARWARTPDGSVVCTRRAPIAQEPL